MLFRRTDTIEAEGFRDGSHGVRPVGVHEELAAGFARLRERAAAAAADRLKRLEAECGILERRAADSERHWRNLEAETSGMPPQVVMPLTALLLAGLAAAGESVLLAPVMDGFGIADPSSQYFTALVIVLTCGGLLELTIRQIAPVTGHVPVAGGRDSAGFRKALRAASAALLTALAFSLVIVLGWWRAEEMIFAASVQEGEWGGFLGKNAMLTRSCVTLLTVGLPVFAAVVFQWAFSRLGYATEWRKARAAFRRHSRLLELARKLVEAEREKTARQMAELCEQREEWWSAYRRGRELGQAIGARQLPLWQVLLKVCVVALCVLTACLLLDPVLSTYTPETFARLVLYAVAALGAAGVYACRAVKAWDRPTARQLYEQRAVLWHRDDRAAAAVQAAHALSSESAVPVYTAYKPEAAAAAANGNGKHG